MQAAKPYLWLKVWEVGKREGRKKGGREGGRGGDQGQVSGDFKGGTELKEREGERDNSCKQFI